MLPSTVGTDHDSDTAESRYAFATVSAELVVARAPKLAVIADVPADSACIRVLLDGDTSTTAGVELLNVLCPVTVYVDESLSRATTRAVAWKYAVVEHGSRPTVETTRLPFELVSG